MGQPLGDWLDANEIDPGAFAARIGVSANSLYRYRTGRKIPRPDPMRRIYVESGGAVDPNSFYDLPDLGADGASEDAPDIAAADAPGEKAA